MPKRAFLMLLAWLASLLQYTAWAAPLQDNQDDFFRFRTRPDIVAPRWNITDIRPHRLAPGYFFAGPYIHVGSVNRGDAWIAPHIYDEQGELIWSGAPLLDHYRVNDFRVQRYRGQDVLTVIYHHTNAGVIIDNQYQIIREIVHTQDYMELNMHEFNLFHDGSRALMETRYFPLNLTREISATIGYDGNCAIKGNGFHYLDLTVEPPRLLMDWNATDHIALKESMVFFDTVDNMCVWSGDNDDKLWDPHHINSLDLMPSGDILVSARLASTVYKISHIDGRVLWRLGGNMSDFTFLNREAEFYWQHHARFVSENATHTVLSIFDNEMQNGFEEFNIDNPLPSSRGIILALNHEAKTAELVSQFLHPLNNYTNARGSVQILPNENVFVGWANHLLNSEHAPDGELLRFAHILPNIGTYRSQKSAWVGRPAEPPSVYSAAFLSGSNITTMVFVSWNGDTETKSWHFYSVDADGNNPEFLGDMARIGFETDVQTPGFVRYVMVEARDVDGQILATSRPVATIPPVGLAETRATASEMLRSPLLALAAGVVLTVVCLAVVRFWRERGSEKWRRWHAGGGLYERVADGNENEDEGDEKGEGAEFYSKESDPKLLAKGLG